MTKEELIQRIHAAGLSRVADDLAAWIKPSIRIVTQPANEDDLPLGSSKFGGLPDLPPGVDWPHQAGDADSEDVEDAAGPLLFLAQIRLDELPLCNAAALMPKSGILYFFAAVYVDALGWTGEYWRQHQRVIYYDGDLSGLQRTSIPPVPLVIQNADYEPEGHQYPACALNFIADVTLPNLGWGDGKFAALMTEKEQDQYNEKLWDLHHGGNIEVVHRLLGYPQQVQGDMRSTAHKLVEEMSSPQYNIAPDKESGLEAYKQGLEAHERKGEAKDWQLLLQVDSDRHNELYWQGEGRGYFWIADKVLQSRDFSKVALIHQCT